MRKLSTTGAGQPRRGESKKERAKDSYRPIKIVANRPGGFGSISRAGDKQQSKKALQNENKLEKHNHYNLLRQKKAPPKTTASSIYRRGDGRRRMPTTVHVELLINKVDVFQIPLLGLGRVTKGPHSNNIGWWRPSRVG